MVKYLYIFAGGIFVKKLLALLLSIILILSICPMGLFSITASAETEGYYTYTVSNGGAEITDVSTSISGAITIPSTLGGYPVKSIGDHAFEYCRSLESIVIPDTVTYMGDYAFAICESLTSINIPNGVETLGYLLFWECRLLKHISIPKSVRDIVGNTFEDCSSLESITVDKDNPFYHSKDNCIIETDGSRLVSGCKNSKIPDYVIDLLGGAFSGCSSLESIVIPNGVISIGRYAFSGCTNLKNITIPESVILIDEGAFFSCESLESIKIPKLLSSIEYRTFFACRSLKNVIIPDAVADIFPDSFSYCDSLESVTIPESVRCIYSNAFYRCDKLTDVWYMGERLKGEKNFIYPYNEPLLNATWHYKACSQNHKYTDGKDTSCEFCEWMRICGDFDGDNSVNSADLLLVKNDILNFISNDLTYDITGDGNVDVRDLVRVKRISAGLECELNKWFDKRNVSLEKESLQIAKTNFVDDEIMELPTKGLLYSDIEISWSSDNSCAVVEKDKLTVTRQDEKQSVQLSATLVYGNIIDTKVFTITVEALPFVDTTPYYAVIKQAQLDKTLYLNSETISNVYLSTTENVEEAVIVYKEIVPGGYKFFILSGDVRQYITVYFNSYSKPSLKYDALGDCVYNYDEVTNAWVTNLNGFDCFIGTYAKLSTVYANKFYYITAENTGVSQFPLEFIPIS